MTLFAVLLRSEPALALRLGPFEQGSQELLDALAASYDPAPDVVFLLDHVQPADPRRWLQEFDEGGTLPNGARCRGGLR